MDIPLVDQELFKLYINNSLTQHEREAVKAWLSLPMNELVATHWMRNHWEQLCSSVVNSEKSDQTNEELENLLIKIHSKLNLS
jgi:hypothetical protein